MLKRPPNLGVGVQKVPPSSQSASKLRLMGVLDGKKKKSKNKNKKVVCENFSPYWLHVVGTEHTKNK